MSTENKPRLGVMIATPLRYWDGRVPPRIARALNELAFRGVPWDRVKRNLPGGDKPWNEESEVGQIWKIWKSVQTENEIGDAAFRAEADKYAFEFVAAVGGLCRARNNAVEEFRNRSKDRFLFWLDDDFEPEAPLTLAEVVLRVLSHRQPVVGALYCTRVRDVPELQAGKKKRRPTWAATFMPAAEYQPDGGGLLQVAELAGGATCVHRKVFDELDRIFGEEPLAKEPKQPSIRYRDRDSGETIPGFYQNLVSDGDLLSEDYFFNYLLRCAKIPILADTKLKLRQVDASGVYPAAEFPPIPAVDESERRIAELEAKADKEPGRVFTEKDLDPKSP